jgi:hypothetical protein
MTHIALLGDSVIDNKAYVGGAPDVAEQLRVLVPNDSYVTRLAADGSTCSNIEGQLEGMPEDVTHLVISAGGNDALAEVQVLDAPAQSVGEALLALASIQDRLRERYRRMLDAVEQRNLPTAVCSVYDPRFPEPLRRRISAVALSVINDVITREVFSRRFALLDLRVMFNDADDFANPIEPSEKGGMKLARGIWGFASALPERVVAAHHPPSRASASLPALFDAVVPK